MASITLTALNYYSANFTLVNTGHSAYAHMWVVDRIKSDSYDEDNIGDEACAAARCVTRFFFTESNNINSSVKTLSSEMKATLEAYNAVHPTPSNKVFDARLIYYTLFKSLGYPVFNSDNTWYVPLKDYTPDYASSILTPIYVTNLSKDEILQRLQGATTNSKLVVFTAINSYGTLMPLFERTYQEVTSYYMLFHVDNFEYYFDPAYDDDNNIDSWPLNLTTAEYNTLKNYAAISGQEVDFDNWANYLDKENANDNGNYLLVRIENSSLQTTSSGTRIVNSYWNTFVSHNALLPKSPTAKLSVVGSTSSPVSLINVQVKILFDTLELFSTSSLDWNNTLRKLTYNTPAKGDPYNASVLWACYENNLGGTYKYTHILEFNFGRTSSSYTTAVLRSFSGYITSEETNDTIEIDSTTIALPMDHYGETSEYDGHSISGDDEVQDIIDAYNNRNKSIYSVFDISPNSNAQNHTAMVQYCTISNTRTQANQPLFAYSSNTGARYNQFFLGDGNDCVSSDYPNMLNKLYGNKGNSIAATKLVSAEGGTKQSAGVSIPTTIDDLAFIGENSGEAGTGFCKLIFNSDTYQAPKKLLISVELDG